MPTVRVDITTPIPATNFTTEVDLISQSQAGNYSTINYWVRAVNRGSTGAFNNNTGVQSATIGGAGGNGHVGPMPSGVGTNVQRWYDGPWSLNMAHDAAGNRGVDSVAQYVSWPGSWTRTDYGTIGPYPRIPKRPSVPGTPVASNLLPTSVQLDWTASTDNAGSTIDGYLVRRWLGSTPTGGYVDVSQTNTLTRTPTGLVPGTTYTFGIYAHNGSADNSGYSNLSTTVTVTTIAPARVKVAGVWVYAVVYVKVAGVWTVAQPFVKVAGIWKATT